VIIRKIILPDQELTQIQTVLEVKIIQTQELIPQVPIIVIITTVAIPDHRQVAAVTVEEDRLAVVAVTAVAVAVEEDKT